MTRTGYEKKKSSYPKTRKVNPYEHTAYEKKTRTREKTRSDTKKQVFLRIRHEYKTSNTKHSDGRVSDTIIDIYTSKLDMISNLSVSDVKLKQFVLIAKAGLAIGESKEKAKGTIEKDMMNEFRQAVNTFILPPSFNGFDRLCLLRSKNFLVTVDKLKATDLHTGSSLWRKFKELRLFLMNELSPMLAKRLPGGQPPSGKTMAEILVAVRKEAWDNAELKNAKSEGDVKKPFDINWYPQEWEVFTTYGIASLNPADAFNAK
jgi:hypothetical protein